MARFPLITAAVSISLLALKPVVAQNSYITQLPQCTQSCISAVIGDVCNGNDNDWYCFCTDNNFADGYNNVQTDPACQSLGTDCQLSDVNNLESSLTNVCQQAISAGPTSGSSSSSGGSSGGASAGNSLSASPLLAGGLFAGAVALFV